MSERELRVELYRTPEFVACAQKAGRGPAPQKMNTAQVRVIGFRTPCLVLISHGMDHWRQRRRHFTGDGALDVEHVIEFGDRKSRTRD